MNNRSRESGFYLRAMAGVVCLSVFVSSVGGCAPIRQKFIRKKKEKSQVEEFIPVLDPIDYPPKIVSAQERYQYHYSLWRVWQRDLVSNIENQESDKRQKYLIGQVIVQLEEMKKWILDDQKAELDPLIHELREISEAYATPAAMRNPSSLKRKLEANARKVRDQFNPEQMNHFLAGDEKLH